MENYEIPKLEILEFDIEDVITTSNGGEGIHTNPDGSINMPIIPVH